MSDAPQGPGWWQASDGKWYPPEQFTGEQPTGQQTGPQTWTPDAVYQQPGQPYGGQPYTGQVGYGYGELPPSNETLAVVSLVLGIVAIPLMCLCGIFSVPCSIGAIVTGIMARRKIKESDGQLTGDGLALAGLIIGAIAAALSIIGLFAWGALMVAGNGTT